MIGALCSFCGDLVATLTRPWRQLFWLALHLYISVWSVVLNWFTEVATRTLRIVTAFRREKEVVFPSFLDKWVQRSFDYDVVPLWHPAIMHFPSSRDPSGPFLVLCKHYVLVSELWSHIYGIIYSCAFVCCIVDSGSLVSHICIWQAVDNENSLRDCSEFLFWVLFWTCVWIFLSSIFFYFSWRGLRILHFSLYLHMYVFLYF